MRLLSNSPFPDPPIEIRYGSDLIRLRANQIVLWMSLTQVRLRSPNPLADPFPVILDTGFTHTLAINTSHLSQWARLEQERMPRLGSTNDRGLRVPLVAANLWLHPNVSNSREPDHHKVPMSVSADQGIAVYPQDFPRLPILGLRAIADNDLVLKVDGKRRSVTLGTQFAWWPFGW
jgi:hypothetical protein